MWQAWLLGLLYVALFTWLNYGSSYIDDLHDSLLWSPHIFTFHFVIYFVPFIVGYFLQSMFDKDWDHYKKLGFWLLAIFAVSIFCLRSSVHLFSTEFWYSIEDREHARWLYSVSMTVLRLLLLFLLIAIYWFFTDRKRMNFYGFTLKGFDTKPYFVMLLIMLPLIILASTQGDFLGAYPRGAKFPSLDLQNQDHWSNYAIYELFYGLDFFSIEFFFRGFLVMAFIYYAGPKVILPMALMYMTIHYGKPAGELISSFFGGTLLGIIAYYSRSIIGGIIVHVGIAWLMEIGALIGNIYKG